ncbi:unnamed protein product [Dibothriocephalus latus]|uniref:Uncharacterized protein n=1 Tax=Dibothriocephalus latus TaxID=60516 RepID=A0A3P6QT76_DIBLA|nr:unnamed protein product [Dibothriocephalus latus]
MLVHKRLVLLFEQDKHCAKNLKNVFTSSCINSSVMAV